MNPSKNNKISSAITPTAGAAAQSDIEASELDMSGWEGVLVIVRMGAIDGSAVTSIKMQQDTVTGMGSAADLEGTGQTIADDDDEKTFYIDLYRPTEQFVRLYVVRGTADAVVSSAHYIQYGGSKYAISHGSNVSGELHVTPDEGTA